jgi:5-methylcytosine-specific restriction endonuclease McrA
MVAGAVDCSGGAETIGGEGGSGAPGNGRGRGVALPVDAQAAANVERATAPTNWMAAWVRTPMGLYGIGIYNRAPYDALTARFRDVYSLAFLTPRQRSGKISSKLLPAVAGGTRTAMEQTLLLNASYEPLKIVDWQKAVTLWCQGKVEVISVYDREIRAVSISFKLPSVIRLLRYIKIKRRFDYVPFSRANIYARDDHRCQYCGTNFPTSELTFDHVVPVAQGGRKDWENIVTCCVTCNRTKGGRTPAEAHMHLLRAPRRPDSAPAIRIKVGLRNAPESWRDYLYWNAELDDT